MAKPRSEITDGAPATTDKRRKKRISVYLNDDGQPDWSGVSDEQRELLGGRAPEPAQAAEPIAPEMVGLLLRGLTAVESAILSRTMNLPSDQVTAALTIPPPIEQPLCVVGARVIDKHFGGTSKWQDEIVLCSLLLTWQGAAVAQLRALAAELAAKEAEPKQAPPAPIEQRESRTTEPQAPLPPPRFISEEQSVLTPFPLET